MDCPGSEEIAAHAEGRLEASESELLLEHCSECDDCRRELAILTQAHPAHPLPAEFKARTVKAIIRTLDRDRDRTPRHLRAVVARGRRRPGIAWAAAAAVVITVAGMIALVQTRTPRGTEKTTAVKPLPPASPEAPRPERVVPESPTPRIEEKPKRPELPEPAKGVVPKVEEKPRPAPETLPDPVVPPPPPKFEETRPEEPPARPTHTIVARALSEVQVTDVTGALTVKRKGAKEKEKLGSVARLGEGDVVTAEKTASLQVEGRHPLILGDNTSVSLAFSAQDQAPYLHIRSGEAMVDSTGPTRWVVSDGRVALVIKQARARFSTAPGDDRLHVTALSEPIYVQPDGGQVHAVRAGEELQVGRGNAEVRPLDPAAVAKKIAAFDAARPRQRTIFFTSCDPADAKREHFFVQEGTWFKNEALLSREGKDKTVAAAIGPNPRFTWREGLVLRFRFMTNAANVQMSLRVEERRYTLFKDLPVERKRLNQWIPVEIPIGPGNLGFRRDDGQMQLTITTLDKFDSLRFVARRQDVFGDQSGYILIDDIQVVEKDKE